MYAVLAFVMHGSCLASTLATHAYSTPISARPERFGHVHPRLSVPRKLRASFDPQHTPEDILTTRTSACASFDPAFVILSDQQRDNGLRILCCTRRPATGHWQQELGSYPLEGGRRNPGEVYVRPDRTRLARSTSSSSIHQLHCGPSAHPWTISEHGTTRGYAH